MGDVAGGFRIIVGAVPDVPTSAIGTLPPLLLIVSVWLYVLVVIGENVTLTVADAPAASVAPDAGRPVAEKGAVGVWVRPPILLIQLSGFGAGSFADLIIEDFDQIMATKEKAQIFFEMGGMQNYESGLRTKLTSHFAAHRPRIASLHVFTRSRLVSMGVAVANLDGDVGLGRAGECERGSRSRHHLRSPRSLRGRGRTRRRSLGASA